jgi:hypothetical protein
MVSPPVGFCPWSHGTFFLQSLDVSIFDMAFYPVPMKVHGNLLFLDSDSAILLFFFCPAIISFLLCCLPHGLSRHLLFCFGCDILRIGIRHMRMGGVSGLLQRRIFFLGVGRMAGRRSSIHVDGGVKVCSRYEITIRAEISYSGGKWPASRDSGWWLTGDRGALIAALRRENVHGRMRCETEWGDRPGYI